MNPGFVRYEEVGAMRSRRRSGHPWLKLLFIAAVCLFAVNVGATPWAVHMGGRWTPMERWQGFGPIRASNGGRYLLMTDLHGGIIVRQKGGRMHTACSQFGGCDDLWGTGTLCSQSGRTYTFDLRGRVHGWWTTDGARTSIGLTGGAPEPLGPGWVVAFHGTWDGPVLHLQSPDNSFTEKFTPAGKIRHVTSTADAGTADLTLQWGSADDFAQACRALAARRA